MLGRRGGQNGGVRSYQFTGEWWLAAPPGEVSAILTDLEHYPEWWPQVVAVASLGPDDAWVVCRSVLPYSLDLVLHAVHRDPPLLEVAISGDLDGVVRFRLTPERGGTLLVLDQRVGVRGLLVGLSPLLRPLLRWNHHRMMDGGVEGLRHRLEHRRRHPEHH